MKGLSVVFTIVLLVLAQQLATHLRQIGALPAEAQHGPSPMAATSNGGQPITPNSTLAL
ncbi:MAG TPA: hypothetical protein VNT26_07445 [Candidatus Sulfotelmatobacter sp.]|nr:hypothetical protein [Candidatus Sulfotelmatobacter sp.]HWI60172.1 hypothetical protein [Bacillota bacterium]